MPCSIVLDGTHVTIANPAADGITHTCFFGATDDGRPIFVKIEQEPGRLAIEAAALAWAAKHAIAVPSVIGFGPADVDGTQKLVLITEQVVDGIRPIDPLGWRRMGMALAALANVPVEGCPLKRFDNAEFAYDQSSKLAAVRHLLPNSVIADIRQAIERTAIPRLQPVFTHGDPGGGNFLYTANRDILFDWECAIVAPFGLDFGRAHFLALLDIQGTGKGRLLADAFRNGYLAAAGGRSLSNEDRFAWSTVAGLQFTFSRWSRRREPRTRDYHVAIDVLKDLH
jgi:Phosphotransferase enzyme family